MSASRVDVDGNLERALTVGAGRSSPWSVPIATIPPAPAGTYDLVVQCSAGGPAAFRINAALRYAPDYVATATRTQPNAAPTPPPAP